MIDHRYNPQFWQHPTHRQKMAEQFGREPSSSLEMAPRLSTELSIPTISQGNPTQD